MNGEPVRVLLVEDNPGDARLIERMLEQSGPMPFRLRFAEQLADALEHLRQEGADVVLLDLRLPDSQGLGTFLRLSQQAPQVATIVLTGTADDELAMKALQAGAQDYLVKGQVDGSLLARCIRHAIERKQAERALQESERKLRGLIEHSRDGIVVQDEEGLIVEWNPALEQITGLKRTHVIDRSIWDNPRLATLLAEGSSPESGQTETQGAAETPRRGQALPPAGLTEFEYVSEPPDSTKRSLQLLAFPIPTDKGSMVASVIRDVTEHELLQQQFYRAQKLESIGRLAGGVAHDFNNLLTVVIGHASLARDLMSPESPVSEHVREVLGAAERAANLTRRLLVFSRSQPIEQRVLNLNDVISDLGKMLNRLIGEDIQPLTALAPDLWPARVDPGQIEQVLVNLAVNARDAMPRGGTLTIETANATLDEQYVSQHPGMVPGQYVMVAVGDTGVGMNERVQEHLFEPFFTTKEVGKGTGLGLATVFGVVKQHNGHIWVDSEVGEGTTFRMYFPREREETEGRQEGVEASRRPRGDETILVVEDEPSVCEVTCRILRELGYSVLGAANGRDALRLINEDRRHIDLLITDMVMPRIGGRELAARMLALRPGLQALLVSGYPGDSPGYQTEKEEDMPILRKPFTSDELAQKVREILAGTEGP